MTFDASKISPAPWETCCGGWRVVSGDSRECHVVCDVGTNKASRNPRNAANAEFMAIARNAFDIMMRRQWWVVPHGRFWRVRGDDSRDLDMENDNYPDPFTALIEADKWYRENVEKTP